MTSHVQHGRLLGKQNSQTSSLILSFSPENQIPTSEYTLRRMNRLYQGQVYKMFSRLPLYNAQLSPEQIMGYKTIMDSMTDIELDGLNPEHISAARIMEITRESRQGLEQVGDMMREFMRLRKVWRHVERLMSHTNLIDMSALFWIEIATSFNVDIVPEAENIPPPRKFELLDWVNWPLIKYGTYIFWIFGWHELY